MFFELYIILETTTNYTNVWLNRDSKIVPSDKSELFHLLKRLFETTTEFLNGPCL